MSIEQNYVNGTRETHIQNIENDKLTECGSAIIYCVRAGWLCTVRFQSDPMRYDDNEYISQYQISICHYFVIRIENNFLEIDTIGCTLKFRVRYTCRLGWIPYYYCYYCCPVVQRSVRSLSVVEALFREIAGVNRCVINFRAENCMRVWTVFNKRNVFSAEQQKINRMRDVVLLYLK